MDFITTCTCSLTDILKTHVSIYIYIYIGFYLLVLVFDTKLSCWKLTYLICLLKLLTFDRQYVK